MLGLPHTLIRPYARGLGGKDAKLQFILLLFGCEFAFAYTRRSFYGILLSHISEVAFSLFFVFFHFVYGGFFSCLFCVRIAYIV